MHKWIGIAVLLSLVGGFAANATDRNCSGLLVGPRVRGFVKANKSEFSILVYELNRKSSAKFVSLEIAVPTEEPTISLHFVEPLIDRKAHNESVADEQSVQKLFPNAFYRRAWLLAAALRDLTGVQRVEFAWDGDTLSWLDFQDNRNTPERKWLSQFMARRGFREEEISIQLPLEQRALDGSLIRKSLEGAHAHDWHARSVYLKPSK